MAKYIHLSGQWPTFTWNDDQLIVPLSSVRPRQGRPLGKLEGLGFQRREEATLQTLTQNGTKVKR